MFHLTFSTLPWNSTFSDEERLILTVGCVLSGLALSGASLEVSSCWLPSILWPPSPFRIYDVQHSLSIFPSSPFIVSLWIQPYMSPGFQSQNSTSLVIHSLREFIHLHASPAIFFGGTCFYLISNLQENCKNSTRSSHIIFTQVTNCLPFESRRHCTPWPLNSSIYIS